MECQRCWCSRTFRFCFGWAWGCDITLLADGMGKAMKRLSLTLLVAAFSLTAHPQGTVLFDNIHVGAPNAPVFESDGVTKLSGPQFTAELFAGPSVNSLASIAMTG